MIMESFVSHTAKVQHLGGVLSAWGWLVAFLPLSSAFYSMSMSNLAMMNLTMWGGSTLALGSMPMAESSCRKGLHQFIRVLTETPARSASSDFDIDFIE